LVPLLHTSICQALPTTNCILMLSIKNDFPVLPTPLMNMTNGHNSPHSHYSCSCICRCTKFLILLFIVNTSIEWFSFYEVMCVNQIVLITFRIIFL
jgi:hypothetical protein